MYFNMSFFCAQIKENSHTLKKKHNLSFDVSGSLQKLQVNERLFLTWLEILTLLTYIMVGVFNFQVALSASAVCQNQLYFLLPVISVTVQGGQRAIIFSRIGGLQNTVYREGIHVRIPWFQYPIIYDIRSKPRRISSPTGSKGEPLVISVKLKAEFFRDSLCRSFLEHTPISCLSCGSKFSSHL